MILPDKDGTYWINILGQWAIYQILISEVIYIYAFGTEEYWLLEDVIEFGEELIIPEKYQNKGI